MPEPMSRPTSPTVRRAGAGDVAALDTLNQVVQRLHADAMPGVFKQPLPGGATAFFADALQRADVVVFVAEIGYEIVGYLFAEENQRLGGAFTNESHIVDVHHIAVDDGYRRLGVGRVMLEAADTWAHDHGLTDLRLDHWAFNDDAHEFFTGLGFTVENVRLSRPVSDPGRARFGDT